MYVFSISVHVCRTYETISSKTFRYNNTPYSTRGYATCKADEGTENVQGRALQNAAAVFEPDRNEAWHAQDGKDG